MGVDLGIKVPAVVHIIGTGQRFVGTGRMQRAKRRQFYAHSKALQHAKKVRAVRKRQGKERRWMRDINHKLSHQIVSHATAQGVGTIRLEQLAGIRPRSRPRISQRTARTRRGANRRQAARVRTNTRMLATWTCHQLATCIAYKAERAGIAAEWIDPAHSSQQCPACLRLNTADDRHSVCVCAECGWRGHRDAVGAITSSRRTPGTGRHGQRAGATVAGFDQARRVDGLPETTLGLRLRPVTR